VVVFSPVLRSTLRDTLVGPAVTFVSNVVEHSGDFELVAGLFAGSLEFGAPVLEAADLVVPGVAVFGAADLVVPGVAVLGAADLVVPGVAVLGALVVPGVAAGSLGSEEPTHREAAFREMMVPATAIMVLRFMSDSLITGKGVRFRGIQSFGDPSAVHCERAAAQP
jgi:hypothetical protein